MSSFFRLQRRKMASNKFIAKFANVKDHCSRNTSDNDLLHALVMNGTCHLVFSNIFVISDGVFWYNSFNG